MRLDWTSLRSPRREQFLADDLFAGTDLSAIEEWAMERWPLFTPNDPSNPGGYGDLNFHAPPALVWDIRARIDDQFDLVGQRRDPILCDICAVILEGAIPPHTDPNLRGSIHVRFNVLVSKSTSGGDVILGDDIYPVDEGVVWRNYAGVHTHSCTPVGGPKPRIILSFGYQLPLREPLHRHVADLVGVRGSAPRIS